MGYWLKIGYFTDSLEASADYWMGRSWVSDSPGRESPRWNSRRRPRKGTVYPPHGPRYQPGDRLVIYTTGIGKCPAIVEVVGEPTWDPGRVDAGAKRGEGDTWGVVTEVRGVVSRALAQAPELEKIGVAVASVGRKGHLALSDWQYAEAERLLRRDRRPSRSRARSRSKAELVAPEQNEAESYQVTTRAASKTANRREARLVAEFTAWLRSQGDEVCGYKLQSPDSSRTLRADLFNVTRKHLIEAKAGTSREEIRMAIGQLADYSRLIPGRKHKAILLTAKPQRDLLNLLGTVDVAVIWKSGDGFEDDQGGRFV